VRRLYGGMHDDAGPDFLQSISPTRGARVPTWRPLRSGRVGVVLDEGSADEGRDDAPALPPGMRQHIAHEADAAALPGGVQHLSDSGLDAFMAIGDHQLDAAQTAPGERAQELRPEGLGLRRPDIHAEYFPAAVAVDADRAVRAPVSPSTSSSIRRWAVKPIEKDQRDKFYHALAAEPGCQVSLELFVKYCKLHFAASKH